MRIKCDKNVLDSVFFYLVRTCKPFYVKTCKIVNLGFAIKYALNIMSFCFIFANKKIPKCICSLRWHLLMEIVYGSLKSSDMTNFITKKLK